MTALIEVILPVFLVIGFGYVAVWQEWFPDAGADALVNFAQKFAIPVLLFRAISKLDLSASFDLALLGSFYTGAFGGFLAGFLGARFLFKRPWEDSVAIGFATLFSNSVLLGLPISERAFGVDSLAPNFAIIAIHAPFCYVVGITAMEMVKADGRGLLTTLWSIAKSMLKNPLVIGIIAGFAVNLTQLPLPAPFVSAVDLLARAGLPVALFGLGGGLVQYRPEGDLRVVSMICIVSLVLHPAIVWAMGRWTGLAPGPFRAAVLTAAMAPGINTYVFANMYGVAKRVAATAVLVATAVSVVSVWIWLGVLQNV